MATGERRCPACGLTVVRGAGPGRAELWVSFIPPGRGPALCKGGSYAGRRGMSGPYAPLCRSPARSCGHQEPPAVVLSDGEGCPSPTPPARSDFPLEGGSLFKEEKPAPATGLCSKFIPVIIQNSLYLGACVLWFSAYSAHSSVVFLKRFQQFMYSPFIWSLLYKLLAQKLSLPGLRGILQCPREKD